MWEKLDQSILSISVSFGIVCGLSKGCSSTSLLAKKREIFAALIGRPERTETLRYLFTWYPLPGTVVWAEALEVEAVDTVVETYSFVV
jgi:hypothetical protein